MPSSFQTGNGVAVGGELRLVQHLQDALLDLSLMTCSQRQALFVHIPEVQANNIGKADAQPGGACASPSTVLLAAPSGQLQVAVQAQR